MTWPRLAWGPATLDLWLAGSLPLPLRRFHWFDDAIAYAHQVAIATGLRRRVFYLDDAWNVTEVWL